jgi:hypothetical protein
MDQSNTAHRSQWWPIVPPAACELFLLALTLLLVLPWAPLYVQWPRWSDHEHFASLAYGWSNGLLPYRDFININFPGEVYLFWLLGQCCGWSAEWSIYAFDLMSLAAAAVFLLIWSRRVTGRFVAGLGFMALYLSYYTTLSYLAAAQRDSHTALLVVACVLLPLGWHGRWSVVATGVCFALACIIRPHVITLAPAVALALGLADSATARWLGAKWLAGRWLLAAAAAIVTTALLWLPIILAGLWPDFLESMRLNLTGSFAELGGAGRPAFSTLLREAFWTKSYIGVSIVVAACGSCAPWMRWRPVWRVVLATQLGGLLYILMHPARHNYLEQPLMAAWALGMGLFLAEIVAAPIERRWSITIAVILALVFQYPHAQYNGSVRLAFKSLLGRSERLDVWKRKGPGPTANVAWDDYASARHWISQNTSSDTRIANMAWGIYLASNLERLPALPIEIPWIWYHRDSEPRIRQALEADRDMVLIWTPDTFRQQIGDFPELMRVIERDYEPAASFGSIEIRRRMRP